MNNYVTELEARFEEYITDSYLPAVGGKTQRDAIQKDINRIRMAWIGEVLFGFCTYEEEFCAEMTRSALDVADAISNRYTFDYISNDENYRWYLLMVNMPFFENKLEWGTSIRGAWWVHFQTFEDVMEMTLNRGQLKALLKAARTFVGLNVTDKPDEDSDNDWYT